MELKPGSSVLNSQKNRLLDGSTSTLPTGQRGYTAIVMECQGDPAQILAPQARGEITEEEAVQNLKGIRKNEVDRGRT